MILIHCHQVTNDPKAMRVRKSRTPEKDLRVPFPVTLEAENPSLSPPLPSPHWFHLCTTRCQLRCEIAIERWSPFFRSLAIHPTFPPPWLRVIMRCRDPCMEGRPLRLALSWSRIVSHRFRWRLSVIDSSDAFSWIPWHRVHRTRTKGHYPGGTRVGSLPNRTFPP